MKATKKNLSRRSFIGTSATLAAGLTLAGAKLWGAPAYIPNLLSPNYAINGVQLGVITYSFREMENQSAEAILQYVLDCGINSIELMGGTAETFIGRPENKTDRRKFYMLSRKARKNELSKDEWSGPFKSSFGHHIVLLKDSKPGYFPLITEVLNQVEVDLLAAQKESAVTTYIDQIKSEYKIIINPDLEF